MIRLRIPSLKIGDKVEISEHDGIYTKTIESIFWREKNKGNNAVEKIELLYEAKDWCIVLFTDKTWVHGSELTMIETI